MQSDGKINILLVDDKPEKLLALAAVLDDLGQNIVQAYSGREALRCLLNDEFAVILLDVNMPGMDGFETAATIRQRPVTRDVPIIFVTAMDDDTHVSRGYSLGAVDYIQTPVMPEVLKTKVSVFVDLFRKTEQVRRQASWLRQQATRLHQLTAASLAINSALSTEQMLQVVTDTAREIVGGKLALATLVSDRDAIDSKTLHSQTAAPDVDPAKIRACSAAALHTLMISANRPLRMTVGDLAAHPAWQQGPESLAGFAIRGCLAAPLTGRDGHKLGVVEVWDKADGDFTGDDESVLVQLAQMASIAVENTIYAAERETNRIKDEFLSTLSHELRTPLNAILGWTQLLLEEKLNPEVSHGLDVIDRNARAQTKLIEDLLDVSRVSTGKLRVNLRPTVIGPVVEAAVEAFRPTIEAKHIQMDCQLTASAVAINADPDRLQQVIGNLLSNAGKFTPDRGRICVRLERTDDDLRLSISDTGRGIDPAFLPHVFDRFRQADSSSTRTHGGLGLGLMIVRQIVFLHGGSVSADSPGIGQGSIFTVSLPVSLASPGETTRPQRPPAAARRKIDADLVGVRVLVVDDDSDARQCMAATLARAGASVLQASSVAEALEQFARNRPDVLVSDIAMPGRDGFDLIRSIRELGPAGGGEVPAIALTAYARQDDRLRALSAGFHRHIAKPVEPAELAAAVANLARPTRPISSVVVG